MKYPISDKEAMKKRLEKERIERENGILRTFTESETFNEFREKAKENYGHAPYPVFDFYWWIYFNRTHPSLAQLLDSSFMLLNMIFWISIFGVLASGWWMCILPILLTGFVYVYITSRYSHVETRVSLDQEHYDMEHKHLY